MSEPIQMAVDDERPIKCAWFNDDRGDEYSFIVGNEGITEIRVYREAGEMGWVPWIAVYHGDEIWHRFPAHMCGLIYFLEDG